MTRHVPHLISIVISKEYIKYDWVIYDCRQLSFQRLFVEWLKAPPWTPNVILIYKNTTQKLKHGCCQALSVPFHEMVDKSFTCFQAVKLLVGA